MIRKIRTGDDPVLRQKARNVQVVDEYVCALLDDMAETMRHAKGIGLAATQIGLLRRMIVMDIGEGIVELINPEIITKEGEAIAQEGCLSLPGIKVNVSRAVKMQVRGLDRKGKKVKLVVENLLARVIQHEVDHLEGILIKDRSVFVEAADEGI